MHLLEDLGLVFHVMECDNRDDSVERPIAERNRFSASLLEANAWSLAPTQRHFPRIGLEDRDFPAAGCISFRRSARTAPEIEETHGGGWRNDHTELREIGQAFPNAQPLQDPDRRERGLPQTPERGPSHPDFGPCRAVPRETEDFKGDRGFRPPAPPCPTRSV